VSRAVLFDLDDTLFDHRRSARAALRQVHRVYAAGFDFEAFEQHHARYLEDMHLEVLAGRIGLDDARRERFRRVFEALGVALAPGVVDAAASAYREGYMMSRRPLHGAADLLAVLKSDVRIVIVTNNLLEEQQDKLEYCGLAPYVDVLVASLISILEPVMVVVLGLIVGFIVIALFMPMISLIQGISSSPGKK